MLNLMSLRPRSILSVLALLGTLAFALYGAYQQHRASGLETEALELKVQEERQGRESVQQDLTAIHAALKDREHARASRRVDHARAEDNLENANAASPDWADSRTPDAVADSLCEYIPCE